VPPGATRAWIVRESTGFFSNRSPKVFLIRWTAMLKMLRYFVRVLVMARSGLASESLHYNYTR